VPVNANDHIIGPRNAPITMVEYGDFECPFCRQAHLAVKEILGQLGDSLRFVFRHFPLATAHPHAQRAAEAAEAAGAQGRFWEMHDVLFENQDALEDEDLVEYAEIIGVDTYRFADELRRHVHASRVRSDFMGGVRSGVNGTPTFFVNDVRHDGGYDPASLMAAVAG
jgi:protein-disulfide isomerase